MLFELSLSISSSPLFLMEIELSSLFPDVLKAHILTRLDGPSLAALASVSSEMNSATSDEKLWQNICRSMWPSVSDQRVHSFISTLPSGYRSFFYHSYPTLLQTFGCTAAPLTSPSSLISAVDIYYRGNAILSRVVEIEIQSQWFRNAPFSVDVVKPPPPPPQQPDFTETRRIEEDDKWLKDMRDNISLSWIMFGPEEKKAVNLSSHRPVVTERHWLTDEVQMKFSVVMHGGRRFRGTVKECVECSVTVTCDEKGDGTVNVISVCMSMEDLEGKVLRGEETVEFFRSAVENGRRQRRENDEDGAQAKALFQKLHRRRIEWWSKKHKRQQAVDLAVIFVGVTIFMLWCYMKIL